MEAVDARADGEIGGIFLMRVERICAPVVYRAENPVGQASLGLEQVQLSGGCPRSVFLALGQHPDGRPQARSHRAARPKLYAPVCERKLVPRVYPRGGIHVPLPELLGGILSPGDEV